jgi:hypothetical protein
LCVASSMITQQALIRENSLRASLLSFKGLPEMSMNTFAAMSVNDG